MGTTAGVPVHPAVAARGRRRVRAIVGAVLWLAVIALFALVTVLVLSGLQSLALARLLAGPSQLLASSGIRLPDWVLPLLAAGPLALPPLLLLGLAVLLSVVAAAVSPTAIVRRLLAPLVVALATVPTWWGVTQVLRALQRLTAEDFALGTLLLGVGLIVAVLGAWVGLGARAGGLAAVAITAFVTVLVPLGSLGLLAISPDRGSFLDGPGRLVFSLHWLQSVLVVGSTAIAAVLLARAATYRRG